MPNKGRRWRWCAKGGAVVIANNKINPNINPKGFCQFKQRMHSFARCGTVKAKAQFDKELRSFKVVAWKGDILVRTAGVPVVVDPKTALYLKGTQLDYSAKMVAGGFKFSNPNAKASCSCGESFSV